ncbi:MAG: 6-carboxytetrahydropterin synthase QueD [Treponemataceae bacterium]|nr:6-carboxytetrahydropterin synthase QueD [Treponemataceae bacterium]
MFEVRVEADFAAAHFLQDYNGKCENLHGHNYKVYAYAKGNELDEGGMLLDFGKLKGGLREVCKKLDHTNLNDLCENGISVFKQNPSAERISKYIFDKLSAELENAGDKKSDAQLYRVDVFETPTSRATYRV